MCMYTLCTVCTHGVSTRAYSQYHTVMLLYNNQIMYLIVMDNILIYEVKNHFHFTFM